LADGGGDKSFDQVLEEVVPEGSLLMLYYLGHKQSHLFVVAENSKEIRHYPLVISEGAAAQLAITPGQLNRAEAAALVGRYNALLRRGHDARPVVSRGIGDETVISGRRLLTPEQAVALTSVLLPNDARSEIKKLAPQYAVVVPDGALHEVPLEALPTGLKPTKFLLDEFPAIAYAPSIRVLRSLNERTRQKSPEALALLTVGNPAYPESVSTERSERLFKLLEPLRIAGSLPLLPATAKECEQVAAAFQSAAGPALRVDVERIAGAGATESGVRHGLAGKQFIHVAAHALVDQRHENLFGCIALTPPAAEASGADDDGFLFLYEIHELELSQCELAILSACQTNVGPERPLEAGSTMARAFLAAGAQRVVSSHWSVEDQSTAQLIGTFVEEIAAALKENQRPNYALALQKARRAVRASPQRSTPYYWAPFVLIGPAQ
jgi:CHAT domain-containing protein